MAIVQNTDHVTEALALLLEQFKNKTNIEGLLSSHIGEIQSAENAAYDTSYYSILDNATGAQLDRLGKLVGEDRKSTDDDVYRIFIQVRIAINKSNGRTEEIYNILSLINSDTYQIRDTDRASFVTEGLTTTIETSFLDFADATYTNADARYITLGGMAPFDPPSFAQTVAGILQDTKGAGIRAQYEWSNRDLANRFQFGAAPDGENWTEYAIAHEQQWESVCYGNSLFVAVADSGTNKVMTSPDGADWTSQTSQDKPWQSVAYGDGVYVAVADGGITQRAMSSTDGITWTLRTTPVDNDWQGVTWGNGLFVAVSDTGTGDRVMTSPDGTTWTGRVSAADNNWQGIAYQSGLFVAVAAGGAQRVMTSPDGITWTLKTGITGARTWQAVTWGNGVWVAVGTGGPSQRIMYSYDTEVWLLSPHETGTSYYGVCYVNGLFVAVGSPGLDRVIISTDGINWTTIDTRAVGWRGVTFGNGSFVVVQRQDIPIDDTFVLVADAGSTESDALRGFSNTVQTTGGYVIGVTE